MHNATRRLSLLLMVVILFLVFGLVPRWQRGAQTVAATQEEGRAAMDVAVVHPRLVHDPGVLLPGSTEAMEQAVVGTRSTGVVRRRYVDIGSHVHRGQVLAEIDSPDTDQQVVQAHAQTASTVASSRQALADTYRLQAGVAQARAQEEQAVAGVTHAQATVRANVARVLEARKTLLHEQALVRQQEAAMTLADRQWQRYQTLGAQGFVTAEDVDQHRSTYDAARAQLDAARDEVDVDRANLSAAQEALASSQADVRAARQQAVAAGQSVEAARAQLESGRATLDAAHANVAASAANERRYQFVQGFEKVTAPFDGIVTTRNVDVGYYVNQETSQLADPANTTSKSGLFTVARTDTLRIVIQVPQTYVAALKMGLPAEVMVREFPDRTFPGRVFLVAGALDSGSRAMQAEVRVPNPEGKLYPGMYAQVRLLDLKATPSLHVPATALIVDSKGLRLAVVGRDNKVRLQEIQLGRDFGNEVEVLRGIKPDDTVVDNPSDDVVDGAAVNPVAAAAP